MYSDMIVMCAKYIALYYRYKCKQFVAQAPIFTISSLERRLAQLKGLQMN